MKRTFPMVRGLIALVIAAGLGASWSAHAASTSTDVIDGISTSTALKAPVRGVTTTNITLSGLSAISTVEGSMTPADGDRFLLTGQTTASQNLIYVARSGAWEVAKDSDGARDLRDGTMVKTQGGVIYHLTTADTIVPGTTSLTWVRIDNVGSTGEVAVVQTIAALKALTGLTDGQIVNVACYYTCTTPDGGGGPFKWDAASTASDNGGTIIAPDAGGTGRWRRVDISTISVLWFGAKGDGTTDDTAAFNTAMSSLPATGGVVYANAQGKTWNWASAITVPSKVTLFLGPGVHAAAGTNGIEVTVGSTGASGRVVGYGSQTRISHTGTGYAINAFTGNGGQASALVEVADLVINGSASGAGGVRLKAFNGATLRNVEVYGYSTGAGYFLEGVNGVTIFNPNNYSNLYGIRTVGVVVNSVNYSPNAIKVFGGQLRDNPGWGFFDDGSLAATVGASIGNLCSGVVFESNGVNASGTTGHIFLQGASNFKVIGNYFEYGGALIPLNSIVIGDGTHAIKGTYIVGNSFLSATATTTISNVNGEKTHVSGNQEDGAVTNFINNGTASRAIYVGRNSASAATNYFAGSDDGVDSYIFDGGGTQPNTVGTTTVGFGFNVISGFRQDLKIRARSGGGNTLLFEDTSGNNIGSLGLTGKLNVADKIYPGTDAAAAQSVVGIYAGNGAPNNANGSNGDFYFRGDGTAAGKTVIYHKEGGSWVSAVP